jgi:membrane protease YdiL (CAAX protease family)
MTCLSVPIVPSTHAELLGARFRRRLRARAREQTRTVVPTRTVCTALAVPITCRPGVLPGPPCTAARVSYALTRGARNGTQSMQPSNTSRERAASRAVGTSSDADSTASVWLFFALACAITWLCDVPLVLARLKGVAPPAYAIPLAVFGAFGPTLAALVMAGFRPGSLRDVFGRWKTAPHWILIGLLAPLGLHLVATAIEVALGGSPANWFYPPSTSGQVAGMLLFAVGGEFGWRGYAQPRMTRIYGPIGGALLLGVVWTGWHSLLTFSPNGQLWLLSMGAMLLELTLYAVIFVWLLARSNGSIAVAIALRAGAHLDDVSHAPATELRLRALRLGVLALAALLAGRSLMNTPAPLRDPAES